MENFSALLALCVGNSPVTGEFLAQRPVTRSFDLFFDLRPNKCLGKKCEAGDFRRHRTHSDVTVMATIVTVSAEILLKKRLEMGQNGGFRPLSEKVFTLSNSDLSCTRVG